MTLTELKARVVNATNKEKLIAAGVGVVFLVLIVWVVL